MCVCVDIYIYICTHVIYYIYIYNKPPQGINEYTITHVPSGCRCATSGPQQWCLWLPVKVFPYRLPQGRGRERER